MTGLVARVIAIGRIYKTHIHRHFAGIVSGNKHLCLFLSLRQWSTPQNSGIATFCEFHQLLDESLLRRCRRNIVKYLVLVWTVNTDILRSPIISDFVIKSS